MGGSPKRGNMAAGGMSRGRIILLAALGLQLLLVVCLMKAPRLVFLGSSSRASDLVDSADEAASGSWLWRTFAREKPQGLRPAPMVNCTGRVVKELDVNGRLIIRCENQSLLRKVNATVSLRNASVHGLPRESRLRGGVTRTIRPSGARSGAVVDELRPAARQHGVRVGQNLPLRHGSVEERLGAERQRRVRVGQSLPALDGSVGEDLRVARQRRVRVEQDDLPAVPVDSKAVREAAREARISSQWRDGYISDSLERDSFRFRGRGGYGGRVAGEVKEQAREVAEYVSASIAPATRIRASARVPSKDPLEDDEEDLEEDPDVAAARSEVRYVGQRANFGPLPSVNASRRRNTSLEISEALLKNSTGLGKLEKVLNATAPGSQFGALDAALLDELKANVSGINATLSARFGGRNATLRDAPAVNVSSVNATLGAHFGAINASLGDALKANVSGINETLSAQFGARNATLRDALTANGSSINATLGAPFAAHNASLEDALKANVSGINATLDAQFGAYNASLGDAVKANVSDIQNATCSLGLIYVYTLPKKFNTELLESCSSLLRWGDRCRELSNSGLGPSLGESPLRHSQKEGNHSGGPWYGTDQFNGEVIFHQRILTHPCRTRNPELAKAFYIPYYGGLDVARFLFNAADKNFTAADRDTLAHELVEWLARSPYWKRRQGVDHLLMLGRITWDFRRKGSQGWGSSLITMPEMANVTKLALERHPWDNSEIAIPYPTGFHPRNDDEVMKWQNSLRTVQRDLLFSFAGAPRKDFPNDFRIELFNQCKRAKSCEVLDCSERKCEDDSLAATKLFIRSTFCLQPRGDSFTRRSIFDSLIVGCIPVFFWTKSAYLQYYWHLPTEYSSYSVFIPKNDIQSGAQLEQILQRISPSKVQQMQETIRAMIPSLVYAGPQHELVKFKDAFDTTIDKMMANFDQLRMNQTTTVIKQALPAEGTPKQVVTSART